ncbi:serine/threonine-protein kinase [Streptomyces sp. NPDC029216]|uniref:serine/threonine-protein kinase n=1 Tax=Streptomyces sp. NPDC029216 TaxID=3154701 RepID=UPI0033FD7548
MVEDLGPDDPYEIGGFRLLQRLGSGGMGSVYVARATDGHTVAVKVIRPEYARDPDFRRRFTREVRSAQRLSGPGLVAIEAADTEAEQPWLATEFVAAPTLGEVIQKHGPLGMTTWDELARGLGRALQAVHSAAMVHRDLKPANVLLARTGPRLIDFGIARAHDDSVLTGTGQAIGTPGYMAPEYLTGGRADERADLFAYGAVLAYAATGRHPFGAGSVQSVQYRAVHEQPDLQSLDPGRTHLLGTLLAKNPYARPPLDAVLAQIHTAQPTDSPWLSAPVLADIAAVAERLLHVQPRPLPTANGDAQHTPDNGTVADDADAPPPLTLFKRLRDAFNGR